MVEWYQIKFLTGRCAGNKAIFLFFAQVVVILDLIDDSIRDSTAIPIIHQHRPSFSSCAGEHSMRSHRFVYAPGSQSEGCVVRRLNRREKNH